MSNSIGNINAKVTADVSQFVAELHRADNQQRRFSAATEKELKRINLVADREFKGLGMKFSKDFLKGGLGVLGIGTGAAFIGNEIRNVLQDIEGVPGIEATTREKLYAFKDTVGGFRDATKELAANVTAAFVDMGRNFGVMAGAMVYGNEAAIQTLRDIEAADQERRKKAMDEKLAPLREGLKKAEDDYFAAGMSRGARADEVFKQAEAMEAMASSIADEAKQLEVATKARQFHTQALKEFQDINAQVAKADERFNTLSSPKSLAGVNELRASIEALQVERSALEAADDFGSASNAEHRLEITNELIERQRELNFQLEIQQRRAFEVGATLAGSFENAVFSGGKLKDMLSGIADDLIRLTFRKAITEPIAGAIAGGLMSGSAGLFGKILGFADGGRPPVGEVSLVGERGPELFVPDVAGRVIPNHQLSAVGSRGGDTYYIDATGADRAAIARLEAAIRAVNGSIEYRAVGAVYEAKRRRRI